MWSMYMRTKRFFRKQSFISLVAFIEQSCVCKNCVLSSDLSANLKKTKQEKKARKTGERKEKKQFFCGFKILCVLFC